MVLTKEENKALCEKYPFLIPTNRYSGRRITDGAGFWPGSPDAVPEYDYSYTELDQMPEGWRIAFGEQLCAELMQELERYDCVDDFRIVQLKEKFGMLRLYTNFSTDGIDDVIDKYTEISKRTCIRCGKPATHITCGWIEPWCEDCINSTPIVKAIERFVPIDEYYSEVTDEEEDD